MARRMPLADSAAFCEKYGYPPDRSANTIIVASKTAELTGMEIGRVAAFALPADLPIYVDERLMELDCDTPTRADLVLAGS